MDDAENTRAANHSESSREAEFRGEGVNSRIRTPRAYRVCDGITEGLIYFGIVFTPWAFGTTQNWSIWTMNVVCYLLGAALVMKWGIRWRTGFQPDRWGDCLGDGSSELGVGKEDQGLRTKDQRLEVSSPRPVVRDPTGEGGRQRLAGILTRTLAGLTVVILGYVLISAVNARARFVWEELRFDYFNDYIPWLPHSYDSGSTWKVFWQYLGLAFFFWATRDWLLGKTRREARGEREVKNQGTGRLKDHGLPTADLGLEGGGQGSGVRGLMQHGLETDIRDPACASAAVHPVFGDRSQRESRSHGPVFPTRLRCLLWVLCINGALLGLEGILQRLDGTNKLLWLVVPRFNNDTEAQFGPYAYRSNAATYLNLVWPVCLGFWLMLRKASSGIRVGRRLGGGSYIILLPCAVVMASAPIISTSRGGALVALASVPMASGIVFFATRRERSLMRASMLTLFLVIIGFSTLLGWKDLAPRLENVFSDELSGRTTIYRNSRPIAKDFPILGAGPGTFAAIYQSYKEADQGWDAYLHDDWLETRITFGLVGFLLIVILLGGVLVRRFLAFGISCPLEFTGFLWLALGGCLLHAKFDFPLQVYSILFAFLILCAILSCLSRK